MSFPGDPFERLRRAQQADGLFGMSRDATAVAFPALPADGLLAEDALVAVPEHPLMGLLAEHAPGVASRIDEARRAAQAFARRLGRFPPVRLARAIGGDDPLGFVEGPGRAVAGVVGRAGREASERVVTAAIRWPGLRKPFVGANHPEAYERAAEATGFPVFMMENVDEGFLTSTGRFLSRTEAFDLAKRNQQIRDPAKWAERVASLQAQGVDRVAANKMDSEALFIRYLLGGLLASSAANRARRATRDDADRGLFR